MLKFLLPSFVCRASDSLSGSETGSESGSKDNDGEAQVLARKPKNFGKIITTLFHRVYMKWLSLLGFSA